MRPTCLQSGYRWILPDPPLFPGVGGALTAGLEARADQLCSWLSLPPPQSQGSGRQVGRPGRPVSEPPGPAWRAAGLAQRPVGGEGSGSSPNRWPGMVGDPAWAAMWEGEATRVGGKGLGEGRGPGRGAACLGSLSSGCHLWWRYLAQVWVGLPQCPLLTGFSPSLCFSVPRRDLEALCDPGPLSPALPQGRLWAGRRVRGDSC